MSNPTQSLLYRWYYFAWAARLISYALCLALSKPALAVNNLEQWRNEVSQTRILAENDVPRAYQKAHRLQENIPEHATPSDRTRLLNLHARIEAYLAIPEMAELHANQAMALATKHGDQLGQAEADLNIVLNASNQADLKVQVAAPTYALKILSGVNAPELLAEAQSRQIVALYRQKKNETAEALAMQALETARRSGLPLAMTHAHQGMAFCYEQSGEPAEALNHYSEMRDWARKAQSRILEAEAWLGISIQENALGNISRSERALDSAIEQLRPTGAAFAIARASLTLADRNLPAEALRLLNEANSTYSLRNTKIGRWETLLARSKSNQALNHLTEALADARDSQLLANEIGLNTLQAQSAQRLSAVHAALGNYERAYHYANEAAGIRARLANERTDSYVTELAERDERESQQRKIDELNRRSERQTAKEHWLWTIFLASLALLTTTAFFLFRLKHANRQLALLNAQLEQSRNSLLATYDALPDLLFELDLDGRYYDCHSPRPELLTAPVGDLIGKRMDEVLPHAAADVCMAALREANEHGISTGRQYSLPLSQGTLWFEVSIARKIGPSGQPPRFIALSRDISERKQFESREKIRLRTFEVLAQGGEQQEILELITSYIEEERPHLLSSIMLLNEGTQHLHTACAPRLPASYLDSMHDGIPIGDCIGSCATAAWRRETVGIDDIGSHPYWRAYRDQALAAGLRACWSEPIIGASGMLFGTVCIYRTEIGSPSAAELELARQASHLAAVAIERTRMTNALTAREQEFRTLAENMPDFVARYDNLGRKTYLNKALIEMIGDSDASQLGKTPFDSLPKDLPGLLEYEDKLRRTLSTGQPESMDGIVSRGPRTGEIHNLRFVAERAQDGTIVGALVFSRDISELKKHERQLEESRDLLRELAAHRDSAREEERKRIAREVHDELGQMLSAQRLDIATLKFQFGEDNPKLGERCQQLLKITDQTIQVVRNVATALRPAVIDMGIVSALAWQANEFTKRTSILCKLHIDNDIDLNEEQSIAIFRIVQESLTNITRYAEAHQVYISLESCSDHYYHLAVRDDGKGFNPDSVGSKSFGLIGIRERALMLGGEAHIMSAPNLGTAIEVKIPCCQR